MQRQLLHVPKTSSRLSLAPARCTSSGSSAKVLVYVHCGRFQVEEPFRKFCSKSGSPMAPARCRSVIRSPGTVAGMESVPASFILCTQAVVGWLGLPGLATSAVVLNQHSLPASTPAAQSGCAWQSWQQSSLDSAEECSPISPMAKSRLGVKVQPGRLRLL